MKYEKLCQFTGTYYYSTLEEGVYSTFVHLTSDGKKAVVSNSSGCRRNASDLQVVEITKEEFEEAFRRAMTLIRDNHVE